MDLVTVLSLLNWVTLSFAACMLFLAGLRGSHWLAAPRVCQGVCLLIFGVCYGLRGARVLEGETSTLVLRGVAVAVFLSIAWTSIADLLYERRMEARADRLRGAIENRGG